MYPFSFSEYLSYYGTSDIQSAFDAYIKEGGMSGSYLYNEPEEKYKYLADIFDTLILRDIRQKYKIRNIALMDRIADFMMDNISNLTASRKIAETLTKNVDTINHKTAVLILTIYVMLLHFIRLGDMTSVGRNIWLLMRNIT